MPALTAGPSGCGSTTRAPCALFIPKPSAMSVVTDWTCTPIQPCLTTPLSLSWATTIFTVSEGIATEPPDGENIAVLTCDHVTVDIEGRTAGVAELDRCIDLDEVLVSAGADVAVAGRNNSGSDRSPETERIAEREHPVTHARNAAGQVDKGEIGTLVDLDEGEVGVRISADHLGSVDLSVLSRDLCAFGRVEHMRVCYGIAVCRDEEA